jgi:hypothetical protein
MSNVEQGTLFPDQVRRKDFHRTGCRHIWSRFAAQAVGPITKGCEIFGICKGQFSLVELIEHCLDATGPAWVVVSTWTAGNADIEHFGSLVEDARIVKCFWIVDFSFISRQAAYAVQIYERFGTECITTTSNHAKFVLIGNKDWKLAIRTSMNLNKNSRAETYEISDSPALYDFLWDWSKGCFKHGHSFENCAQAPDAACRTIDVIGGQTEVPPIEPTYGGGRNIRYGELKNKVFG